MNFLIAGACGFIGSNLCLELLRSGNQIVGIDNLNDILYTDELKRQRLKELLNFANFKFINENLQNTNLYQAIDFVEYDVVINESGLPGQLLSWSKINEYLQSNVEAAFRLAEFCVARDIPKFVQASTSSVYGDHASGDENLPINPSSPYGVTKFAAEQLLAAVTKNSRTELVTLRYFSVYGPGQRPDMGIYKFIQALEKGEEILIYGDGNQTRDLTYVMDAVNATVLAAIKGKDGAIYNVSGGVAISVNELVKLLSEVTGISAKLKYIDSPRGDQMHTKADTQRIRSELAWTPQYGLSFGLKKQHQWQKTLITQKL